MGLGAIGVEMAQALSRLGIEVFAFNGSNKLAGITDPVVSATAGHVSVTSLLYIQGTMWILQQHQRLCLAPH